jgi:hypothetical protein
MWRILVIAIQHVGGITPHIFIYVVVEHIYVRALAHAAPIVAAHIHHTRRRLLVKRKRQQRRARSAA